MADPENSEALVHFVWNQFAARIKDLDERMPGIWRYTERKMVLWVRPTRVLDQLRCIFWARVYESRNLNIKIKKEEILVGFMKPDVWEELIKDDKNLAYLIRPIPRIEAAFEALMWRGLRHLLDWLDTPRDFQMMSGVEQRNFLSTVFRVVSECERRLHPVNKLAEFRQDQRAKLVKELEAEGLKFHFTGEDTSVEDYDLELLPNEDEFGEVGRNYRPEIGERDGGRSNTGYDDDELPEEGFSGGVEEEEGLHQS